MGFPNFQNLALDRYDSARELNVTAQKQQILYSGNISSMINSVDLVERSQTCQVYYRIPIIRCKYCTLFDWNIYSRVYLSFFLSWETVVRGSQFAVHGQMYNLDPG